MITITNEMKDDFLIYATEVNNNRAFPDARDGLKPGMRATLWDMYTCGHFSNKPHVKSAKVSGSTISRLWPHGDGSIYEVIVRMSQSWINNLCEIDFHGANGSLLGGPTAASQRYTECRLSKVSEDGFFTNIKKDAVDMIDNFSEDEKWPIVFPSLFPRLIINGSSGIGYTIAQDWLPHNLNEVIEKIKEYVNSGKVSTDNIYPDFPTGGTIINKSDLESIYKTGKGAAIVRGKVNIEDKFINITELPYQVYAEAFIQKVKDLVNAGTLTGVEDICNKSGDSGLLIEIECSSDPKIILNKLYKLTDLQTTFSANQMALVDGIPQMLNLQRYIEVYVEHNINCIKREYKFDLDKANERLEIVEGLLRAILDIDNIILLIKSSKSSDEARSNLGSKFNFTPNQSKAIVDMRLGKLANLEQNELNKEKTELNKTIDKCAKIINSDKLQKKEFVNRLSEFVEKYGWQRRTQVCDVDVEAERTAAIIKAKDTKIDEEFMICLSQDNNLKRVALNNYKQSKSTDKAAVKCALSSRVILIGESGSMYKVDVKKITACSQNALGIPVSTFVNDNIVNIFSGYEAPEFILMTTANGLIKKIIAKTVFELSKCVGAIIMKVNDRDKIIDCRLVDSDDIITLKSGKTIKTIHVDELIAKGRGAGGIVGIKVKDKLEIM